MAYVVPLCVRPSVWVNWLDGEIDSGVFLAPPSSPPFPSPPSPSLPVARSFSESRVANFVAQLTPAATRILGTYPISIAFGAHGRRKEGGWLDKRDVKAGCQLSAAPTFFRPRGQLQIWHLQ